MTTMQRSVTVAHHDGVAIVAIDNPPVNALSQAVRKGLQDAMARAADDPHVAAVVITGGSGRFIAGADIRELDRPLDEPYLPAVVAVVEGCRKPVVAAIAGPALGGGLEIALAADLRIAARGATFGLPETRLGLIPGAGGTQRLPRLAGVARAVTLIGEGRILTAEEAARDGIVDRVVDSDPVAEAVSFARGLSKRRVSALDVPDGDADAEAAAVAAVKKRARGVPSVAVAADLVAGCRDVGFSEGLRLERARFLALRDSDEARALRYIFQAERDVHKVAGLGGAAARPVERVGVVGTGTMGAGIAAAFAMAGYAVVAVERDGIAAREGAARIAALLEKSSAPGVTAAPVPVSDDWTVLADADLIVEAAYESLEVKTEIVARLDGLARPDALLATNTSYLDIDLIAGASARPGRVLGLHFFAPAQAMKLVEVVRGAATGPSALATALAVARRLGKIPVVAGNAEGFIGNRIYSAYRRHAEYLVEDGASPYEVDSALEGFGFSMGVFAVSDLSGLDIAHAARRRRDATRDPAERYVDLADRLHDAGRLGRKTGAGWYAYGSDGRRQPDPAVTALIDARRAARGIVPRGFDADGIVRRLLAVMANEGAKVLGEGVARTASDIDVAFVNGYGFPRVKGGPMRHADRLGLANVLAEVEAAHAAGGSGSEPAPLLVRLARTGGSFAGWTRENI